jgi:GR25 family glycosyltransferase involved in LPS biosynthesis
MKTRRRDSRLRKDTTRRRDTRRRKNTRRRKETRRRKGTKKKLSKCPAIKKSGENEKTLKDSDKIKDKDVNVFVINLKKHSDRWKKYKGNPNYKRFPAVVGADLQSDNEFLKGKLVMMWNASDKQRRNVVGCYLSHLNLLKKIVRQKLNKTIVLEDDCQIDTKELNKINLNKLPQDKMIYFGGTLRSMTFKTKGWDLNKTRKSLNCDNKKSTLNTIVPGKFKIGGAHCYYYPTWKSAENIVKYLESKERVRAIDSEFAIIQKDRPDLLDSFMYPALGYLVLEQAQKGFSGQYGFDRNMKYY